MITFVLLAGLSAVSAAGLTYWVARNKLLDGTQVRLLQDFRARVLLLSRDMGAPPTRDELKELVDDLQAGRDGEVFAVLGDDVPGNALISAELRAAVAANDRLQWQRVVSGGTPYLVAGSPVMFRTGKGRSGVSVYFAEPLHRARDDDAALVDAARTAAIPIVLLAAVAGLLAARGVLRPVADLGRAARRLAAGRLDTRLPVRGSDELAGLVRTFNGAAAELERSVGELREMEARSRRFVADVSHELRTPLAAATAVSDVLAEGADRLGGDAAVAARLVSAEIERLTRLVDDLMEISRFDAGAAVLNLNEVDVGEAVAACLRARGWIPHGAADTGNHTRGNAADSPPDPPDAPGQATGVRLDLPPGVRATIDPRRLDVIVANLVGNALRHGAPPVTVRLREEEGVVVIEVADEGPGLPPEILPHVFERFYKADSARARSEGSGLGLAIARENALLHGGDIRVENRGGAVFTLTLPRVP
ncbi:ATP-binding protein [Streptosporangium sp. NPDC000396]|uniref:ATP-binding protein n=1 Tax=Streptosporangium sp. NPDC000396 TaxID=3366185 RepID=UPI00367E3A02